MNKLLRKDQPKRGGIDATNTALNGLPKKQPSMHTRRRMTVLNKIFMEHITDMMSTGEIEPELLNRNIEVSHVKITADFKFLNIYWIDNSTAASNTEDLLHSCAFQLRRQLTQLCVMGFVPPIQFVKCRHINDIKEVERRLAIADYGEDHIPNVYPFAANHVVTPKDLTREDKETSECDDDFKISLPLMRHDVFDLDHSRIMLKIKTSLDKSRQTLKRRIDNMQSDATTPPPEPDEQNIPNFVSKEEQEKLFTKFLTQRRREQRLKRRSLREDIVNYDIDEPPDDSDFDTEYESSDYMYEDSEYKDR